MRHLHSRSQMTHADDSAETDVLVANERRDASTDRASCVSRVPSFCAAAWLVVCATLIILFACADAEARRRLTHLHWLPYLLPRTPSWLWDGIHSLASDTNGGMWHYDSMVQPDVVNYVFRAHGAYGSLLDVSCNLGFMLERMARIRPQAHHYGTDVSRKMVAATRERCTQCKAVAPFDLALLANDEDVARAAGAHPLAPGLPATFDLVVVSDVLYFVPFGRWPPYVCRLLPGAWLRASQRRAMTALQRLARREVVFSDHEDNPLVVDFLSANGAVRRPMRRGGRTRSIWTALGTAGTENSAPGGAAAPSTSR